MKKLLLFCFCLCGVCFSLKAQNRIFLPEGTMGIDRSFNGYIGIGTPGPRSYVEIYGSKKIFQGFDPGGALLSLSDGNTTLLFDNEKILGQRNLGLGFDPGYKFTISRLEQSSTGSTYFPLITVDGEGNIEGKRKNGQYANLYRFGGLYLTWDGDTYGTNTHHSIRSTYGDTYGDDITINSFDNIRLNLDANNNNPTSAFEIGQHNTHISNVLFKVESPTGNVGIGTTAPQAKLHVGGDIFGERSLRFTNSTAMKGVVWGSTSWANYYSRIDDFDGQLRVMTDDNFFLTDIDSSTGLPGNVTLYANTNSGTVGIGTISPDSRGKLEVKGHFTLDGGHLYTGTGIEEMNRYLLLLNSLGKGSASGLKAGGLLVSDSYAYANPGKNDLVVKGAIAIGTPSAASKLHVVEGSGVLRTNDNGDGLVLTSYDAAKSIGLSASGNGNYGGTGSVGLKLVNGDISHIANGSITTVFKNNGSVGIGTDNPGNVLEIKKTPLSNKSHLEFGSPTAVSGTASSLMTFAGWGIQHAGFAWVPNSDLTQGKLHIAFGGLDDASQNSTKVTFQSNGFVGIGTTNPSVMLAVNGDIKAKKVNVTLEGWSDFVFEEDYTLRPLSEVEQFIKTHKHLPDVPSEAEVLEKGVELGEMNSLLLQKIEELTLYQIEQEKIIKKQEERLGEQEQQIKEKDAKMGLFQKRLEQIELRLNNLE